MMSAWTPFLVAVAILLAPATSSKRRLTGISPPSRHPGRNSPRRAPDPVGSLIGRWRESGRGLRRPAVLMPVGAGTAVGIALIPVLGWLAALTVAAAVGAGGHRLLAGRSSDKPTDPLHLAAGWDLLAAGLRSGLPVPVTVRAVAGEFTGAAASSLSEVADQLVLGADPVSAWEPALRNPETAELARAARRTARTGSGLAAVADDIAVHQRSSVGQRAQARVQRAAVWVAAPLGLCFLPAFLCLGVLPLVVGMVEQMRLSW